MNQTLLQHQQSFSIATKVRTIALALMVGIAAAIAATSGAQAVQEVNINDGYAVHGYDVVAYFMGPCDTYGRPQER